MPDGFAKVMGYIDRLLLISPEERLVVEDNQDGTVQHETDQTGSYRDGTLLDGNNQDGDDQDGKIGNLGITSMAILFSVFKKLLKLDWRA